MKKTRKALLFSLLSLLVCFGILAGSTFAWFTDEVTSGGNKIVAGNLDVDVKHTNANVTTAESIQGITNLFVNKDGSAMTWEPGAMSYENITISNEGSLALKYAIALNITNYNAVSGSGKSLLDVLKVKFLSGDDILTSPSRETIGALDWTSSQSLDDFHKEGKLAASKSDSFQIIVCWFESSDDNNLNLNNGKSTTDGQPLFIDFGIKLVATQLDSEDDSFGHDYDADLSLPNVAVARTTLTAAPTSDLQITTTGAIKKATISKNAATSVFADTDLNKNIDAEDDKEMVLTLNVENKGLSDNGAQMVVDLEINLNATMTSGSTTNSKELSALDDYTTIEYQIGAGKTGVTATHNGNAMVKSTDVADDLGQGIYSYDSTTGVLTIKTKTFSPFGVSYDKESWLTGVTPYQEATDLVINNAAELAKFAASVNAGLSYAGKTITLASDIDLVGKMWQPIGSNGQANSWGVLFQGTFDGDGHTIKNMSVSDTKIAYTGFFQRLSGNIKDVTFENGYAYGQRVGIVAGAIGGGTISNVKVLNSQVFGEQKCAGIVGFAAGSQNFEYSNSLTISGCEVKGLKLTGVRVTDDDYGTSFGGIVGFISRDYPEGVLVENCKVSGISFAGLLGMDHSLNFFSEYDELYKQYQSSALVGAVISNLPAGQSNYESNVKTFNNNTVEDVTGIPSNESGCKYFAFCYSNLSCDASRVTKVVVDGQAYNNLTIGQEPEPIK